MYSNIVYNNAGIMKNIAVLGDGVTGSAVTNYINNSNNYKLVSINDAEAIVTSPGIPPDQYPQSSATFMSELEFSLMILKNKKKNVRIVGVTGTNGKTTVVSGISHCSGFLAYGNIGTPLISNIDSIKERILNSIEVLKEKKKWI